MFSRDFATASDYIAVRGIRTVGFDSFYFSEHAIDRQQLVAAVDCDATK